MAPHELLSLSVPCARCGGAVVEVPANLLSPPVCHYCAATRLIPWTKRLALAVRSSRTWSWRQDGTRFLKALAAGETHPTSVDQLRAALNDAMGLYRQGAEELVRSVPTEVAGDEAALLDAVTHLGHAMLVKVVIAAVGEGPLSPEQAPHLLPLVLEQLGIEPWEVSEDAVSLGHLRAIEPDLDWRLVLRPFERLACFRKRTADLVTHTSRIVNLVIKLDGKVTAEELQRAHGFRAAVRRHVARFPALDWETDSSPVEPGVLEQLREDGNWARAQLAAIGGVRTTFARAPTTSEQSLVDALRQLDDLVGLAGVKQDVRGMVQVLRTRTERRRQGLPEADLRWHLAFLGNEGNGQGTVAAILGRICAALGTLERGHLTEVDGRGLTTGEVGSSELLARSRQGVLIVHHAACLCDSTHPHLGDLGRALVSGADAGGVLLVFADTREAMQQALASNPVLAAELRPIEFEDHSPVELGRILESLAKAARYRITHQARLELMNGLFYVVQRDGHLPGNGRALREMLHAAAERQAARVAAGADLAPASLVTLEAADFALDSVPDDVRSRVPAVIRTECPRCGRRGRFGPHLLGTRIQCGVCHHEMIADWGSPADR